MGTITVVSGIQKRRRFSTSQKIAMVEEAMQPGNAGERCWDGDAFHRLAEIHRDGIEGIDRPISTRLHCACMACVGVAAKALGVPPHDQDGW